MDYKYQPILKYGIPQMSEHSTDYDRFWAEEERRCIEGYKPPDGVWIPGTYYYHLNHRPIDRLRYAHPHSTRYNFDPPGMSKTIVRQPLYRDGNHLIHDFVDRKRKENRGGGIILKGRQKGITDDFVSILDGFMRFYVGNKLSYCTPSDKQMDMFNVKFDIGNRGVPKAFAQHFRIENVDEMQMGLDVPTPLGDRVVGSESILYTSHIPKASIFKSKNFVFSVVDEIGTFPASNGRVTLSQFWGDTKDCWKRGDMWYGVPMLVGTLDQINYAKNTDLEKFWYYCEAFNLERFLLPADLMYGDYIDLNTGLSDREGARKAIYIVRKRLEALPDQTDYIKEVQNNPLNEDELFLLSQNQHLNVKRVQDLILRINNNKALQEKVQEGVLEWERKTVSDGKYEYTGRVLFIKKPGGPWHLQLPPINHVYEDADIMFVDDYMKDDAPESPSLGAIVIYRRFINHNEICNIPTMTYEGRPPTLKEFHDECLKGAVFTGSRAAVEYHNDMLKDYFINSKKVDGRQYLKVWPRVGGKVVNERDAYGYVVKENEKIKEKELIRGYVDEPPIENCCDIRFLKRIAEFGQQNSDIGSAFGGVLLYNEDMASRPVMKQGERIERQVQVHYNMRGDGIPVQLRHDGGPARRSKFKKLKWMQTINK